MSACIYFCVQRLSMYLVALVVCASRKIIYLNQGPIFQFPAPVTASPLPVLFTGIMAVWIAITATDLGARESSEANPISCRMPSNASQCNLLSDASERL